MAASLQALAPATLLPLLLLLLVLVPHACTAARTTLQDSCERYAAGDQSSYDYCVRTLQRADNRSAATADALGLARIAAKYARATAISTRVRIAALQQSNETLPRARRDCLAACASEYAAAVRRIGKARLCIDRAADASLDGPGYLRAAQTWFAKATGAPARCVAAFAAARQDSPPLADVDFGLDDQIELASFLLPAPRRSPPPPAPAGRT